MKKLIFAAFMVAILVGGCSVFSRPPTSEEIVQAMTGATATAEAGYHNAQATVQAHDGKSVSGGTPVPTVAGQSTVTSPQVSCRVINDYNLLPDMDHVSTSGTQLHVEYWWEGQPERETLLPTKGVAGGRYNLTRSLRGHVWEYNSCTDVEVRTQIDAHIPRRKAGGANNAGFVQWETAGLFQPVK